MNTINSLHIKVLQRILILIIHHSLNEMLEFELDNKSDVLLLSIRNSRKLFEDAFLTTSGMCSKAFIISSKTNLT